VAETLTMVDLILKLLLGFVSLGGIVFAAGKSWSTVSKLLGSTEALHRRMTEAEMKQQHRDETVDAVLMQIRLDIKGIQTWKSTMRFKAPAAQQDRQDMFVLAPEHE
jgi:hypothetical protein